MHAYDARPASLVRSGVLRLPGFLLGAGGLVQGLTRYIFTQERLSPRDSFQKGQPEIAPQLKPKTEEADFVPLASSQLHPPQEEHQAAPTPGEMQDFKSLTLKARCSRK